jgi:hypothetical protein
MSGMSMTFTLLCDAQRGSQLLERLAAVDGEGHDEDLLQELSDSGMYGASRNNALEWTLNAMLRELRVPGLAYLRKGFDPQTGATLDGGPWATLLQPHELAPAAASLRAVVDLARRQPAAVVAAMGDGSRGFGADDLLAAVPDDPATWVDARVAYSDASRDDGDDFRSLFSFVQAQALALEQAHEQGCCILHAAWFY